MFCDDCQLTCFVVRYVGVDVHSVALEHGVTVEAIGHAVRNAMVTDELGR